MCERAVGMEIGRSVVTLDHGDGAARFDHVPQAGQSLLGIGEMFQHETDEDVVE